VRLEVSRRVYDRADRRADIKRLPGLVQRGKTLEGRRHDLLTGGTTSGLLFAVPRPVQFTRRPNSGAALRGRGLSDANSRRLLGVAADLWVAGDRPDAGASGGRIGTGDIIRGNEVGRPAVDGTKGSWWRKFDNR